MVLIRVAAGRFGSMRDPAGASQGATMQYAVRRAPQRAVARAATWPIADRRRRLFNALFATTLVVLAVPPLYLAKSALGIDLMPGPSPLHDLLYWMVR